MPQHRQRLLFVGLRDGVFEWPKESEELNLRDAVGDLPKLRETTGARELPYQGQSSYRELRSQLIDDGTLVLDEDTFRLSRHLLFTSPSAAASVLAGSNTSGRRAWRDAAGRAWSELALDG